MITVDYLNDLKHNWTAVVIMGGREHTIWWTALPMRKEAILKVITVSSDYPKKTIKTA